MMYRAVFSLSVLCMLASVAGAKPPQLKLRPRS